MYATDAVVYTALFVLELTQIQIFFAIALRFFLVFTGESKAVAWAGDEVFQNWEIFCLFVCTFAHQFICPSFWAI